MHAVSVAQGLLLHEIAAVSEFYFLLPQKATVIHDSLSLALRFGGLIPWAQYLARISMTAFSLKALM